MLQSHRKQIVANRHKDSFRFEFLDSECTVSFMRIFNIISEFIFDAFVVLHLLFHCVIFERVRYLFYSV